MPKRKHIKSIAEGILSSFISRNSDVDGYWGIGKLYSLMLSTKQMEVSIDLLNKTIAPTASIFLDVIEEYSERMIEIFERRGLSKQHIVAAKIYLKGFPNEKRKDLGQIAPNRVECVFTITDDLGKERFITKDVWCRPHDPRNELRSTRVL